MVSAVSKVLEPHGSLPVVPRDRFRQRIAWALALEQKSVCSIWRCCHGEKIALKQGSGKKRGYVNGNSKVSVSFYGGLCVGLHSDLFRMRNILR